VLAAGLSDTTPSFGIAESTDPQSPGLADGAAIIRDLGCLRCHAWGAVAVLEEGPALDYAGDKLQPDWIEAFLKDPGASAMPVIPLTPAERDTLRLFLASLRRPVAFAEAGGGDPVRGGELFRENHCRRCHDQGRLASDLADIERKIQGNWLAAFLRDPPSAQPQARMPTYLFDETDAGDLTAFLLAGGRGASTGRGSTDGLSLFVRKACVTCHRIGGYAGRPLTEIVAGGLRFELHRTGAPKVPRIRLTSAEERAIRETLDAWMREPHDREHLAAFDGFDGYWELPVGRQGDPPAGWTGLESSLHPAACGVCHPRQYYDWQSSLHARAYTPGLRAELIATGDPRCLDCHAPLREQRDDMLLRKTAVSCAGCHVRAHRRHGPPLREFDPAPANRRPRHGEIVRDPYFESAEFCTRCHQFAMGATMLNDKLIMNTYTEWQESPAGREGRTCQSCHMPDRRHLWRGIHDSVMVRENLEIAVEGRNIHITSFAGHRTPTYLVPRITVRAWLEDDDGREIPWSHQSWIIQRDVQLEGVADDHEVADTRLYPGQRRTYTYDHTDSAAVTLQVLVSVEPDYYYRNLYRSRLENTDPTPKLRALYEEALAKPLAPPYHVAAYAVPMTP
ncbi:MAG TPA: cytochrome c3 family protein, partial [candidate division Zixibacteria bacterium]|nr:cytochrome c3 family protein [candidate division Zixibacteria bacterium]